MRDTFGFNSPTLFFCSFDFVPGPGEEEEEEEEEQEGEEEEEEEEG